MWEVLQMFEEILQKYQNQGGSAHQNYFEVGDKLNSLIDVWICALAE